MPTSATIDADSSAVDPVFRALADPTRRRMLELLAERERAVGELAESFQLTTTGAAKHLTVLRDSGLVVQRKEGRQRITTLHADPLQGVAGWLSPFEEYWNSRLDSLGHYLTRGER